ncbi:hypothetical protein ACFL3V_01140 [Nanoarchaeota archaeon]
MQKITIISVVLAILLVAGAVFAAADFLGSEEPVESQEQPVVSQGSCASGACGAGCDSSCGGSCGVPSCGCGS